MQANNLNNFAETEYVTILKESVLSLKEKNQEKNFVNGLQNARRILVDLERSLHKSSKYEEKLLRCRATHAHFHSGHEFLNDSSAEEEYKKGETKSIRSQIDLGESWSTMSIVCLQYQYESLSKRYDSLMQAYKERCEALNTRDDTIEKLRRRVLVTHARLARAHKTLLAVGEKYLALRENKLAQKMWYEKTMRRLSQTIRSVASAAERARVEVDHQIAASLTVEKDAASALLLAEIKKCNRLFMENMRLKAQVEELAPGKVNWESYG